MFKVLRLSSLKIKLPFWMNRATSLAWCYNILRSRITTSLNVSFKWNWTWMQKTDIFQRSVTSIFILNTSTKVCTKISCLLESSGFSQFVTDHTRNYCTDIFFSFEMHTYQVFSETSYRPITQEGKLLFL